MPAPFKFLSQAEFEKLDSREQLAYLSDAMEELERTNAPRADRDWNSLFTPAEQHQQPQPKDESDESDAK